MTETLNTDQTEARKKKKFANRGLGHFFQVDSRTWTALSKIAARSTNINLQVAYLVLARGSGRDNASTRWSVNAIETHTGISRSRAREAIQMLLDYGFVSCAKAGSHPQYRLLPAAEISLTEVFALPKPPTRKRQETEDAFQTRQKRWEAMHGFKKKPTWIWLPNALIDGAAHETPPVELIRQTRDTLLLRMFIDMYDAHNLLDDGGIDKCIIWRKYERQKLHEYAQYDLWQFSSPQTWASRKGFALPHIREDLPDDKSHSDFFNRFITLQNLGLIEWVSYLFEGDDPHAEPIHILGTQGDGGENRLAAAALQATERCIYQSTPDEYSPNLSALYCPVARHIHDVQAKDIALLRYRPRTKATSAWLKKKQTTELRWLKYYENIANTTPVSGAEQ